VGLERIKALEIGADDYVTKPFNLREVILQSGPAAAALQHKK
jgi:CheY-like chemotaxis protein